MEARDALGRRVDYLRVSLTDRCNLRCVYCMPPQGVELRPSAEILTFEEIERFAAAAVAEGITKIRLTGGEPLVRRGVVDHVRRLLAATGIEAVALTTNGTLLPRFARPLAEAGLTRVNISIDSLDPDVYSTVTRGGSLARALTGLDAALDAGLAPVKLNVVVVRRLRQDLLAFAKMTLDRPVHVRFIEYMPVGDAKDGDPCEPKGHSGGWSADDHVPADEVLGELTSKGEAHGLGLLEPVARRNAPGGWGPARYYRFPGAEGTVGVISPLSHHFCAECNRLRLTADGRLRPCLFSDEEIDVRTVLRGGSDEQVRALVREALGSKPSGHEHQVGTRRRMFQIGG